jgi:hydroxymethylbilane synthase
LSEKLIIGARGSPLSLAQTQSVAAELKRRQPDLTLEIRPIRTSGDDLTKLPKDLGLKGLFVQEIEKALLAGEIDVAIHSAKDLPLEIPPGLALGPTPARSSYEDALVTLAGLSFADLPRGARIGTSSLRRQAQALAIRPDLTIIPIRGNLDTRLRHLKEGALDGLILALVGLVRLRRDDWPRQVLSPETFTPAPGQGVLALETRAEDQRVLRLLAPLANPEASLALALERGAAKALDAGCHTPAGVLAHRERLGWRIRLFLAQPDGGQVKVLEAYKEVSTMERAQEIGYELGRMFLKENQNLSPPGHEPIEEPIGEPIREPGSAHDR